MSSCRLNPYQFSNELNSFYDVVNASRTIDMNLGGDFKTELTFEMPDNINFNDNNINEELRQITEYVNNDIDEYLSCLATKSESEIMKSLKNSTSQLAQLITLIPKINKLIPNVEKLKNFIPDNTDINQNVESILDSIKVIDKHVSTLIALLLIVLSVLILILSIATITFVSLFTKISSIHMLVIIVIYLIVVSLVCYYVKSKIEKELNTAITVKLQNLKSDMNNVTNQIRSNI